MTRRLSTLLPLVAAALIAASARGQIAPSAPAGIDAVFVRFTSHTPQ